MRQLARLDKEVMMSYDLCRRCRYVVYCQFPRNQAVTECDEFEDMSEAPSHDWNLQDLMAFEQSRQQYDDWDFSG